MFQGRKMTMIVCLALQKFRSNFWIIWTTQPNEERENDKRVTIFQLCSARIPLDSRKIQYNCVKNSTKSNSLDLPDLSILLFFFFMEIFFHNTFLQLYSSMLCFFYLFSVFSSVLFTFSICVEQLLYVRKVSLSFSSILFL